MRREQRGVRGGGKRKRRNRRETGSEDIFPWRFRGTTLAVAGMPSTATITSRKRGHSFPPPVRLRLKYKAAIFSPPLHSTPREPRLSFPHDERSMNEIKSKTKCNEVNRPFSSEINGSSSARIFGARGTRKGITSH